MRHLGVTGSAAMLLLSLGGCGGGERSGIEVSIDAEDSGAVVQCIESSSGLCHVAFAAAAPLRGEIRRGESKRFAAAPGTPVCIEAQPVALDKCSRTVLRQGTQQISRKRVID